MKRSSRASTGIGKGFCSCGLPVLWVRTTSGGVLMLDPEPELAGCYAILAGFARRVRRKGSTVPLYTPHETRCPNGGNLRR